MKKWSKPVVEELSLKMTLANDKCPVCHHNLNSAAHRNACGITNPTPTPTPIVPGLDDIDVDPLS